MELKHKMLIQFMIKNGGLPLEEVLQHYKDEINSIEELKTVINEINNSIEKQHFKIVITTCEITNKEVVLWLNTKDDNVSKYQSLYSAIELEYFHVVLQNILSSEDRRLKFFYAINLTSNLTSSFSRENGQDILYKWLQRQYFIKEDEFIYIGPRLILEFTSYLKLHFPDQICKLCSELVLRMKTCSNCNAIFHSYCLNKYLSKQLKCPSCIIAWTENSQDLTNVQDTSAEVEARTSRSSKYRRIQNK